jgi:pyruvate carboxylase subunit B
MRTFVVSIEGRDRAVRVDDRLGVSVDGGEWLAVARLSPTEYAVSSKERTVRVAAVREGDDALSLIAAGSYYTAHVASERSRLLRQYARSTRPSASKMEVHSPMPALVVKLEVEVGQHVTPGQGLLILEAMKMENEIKAHFAGCVKSIHVQQGKAVEKGELLLVLE